MKLPKRQLNPYGMAFLDVISCGFGAIVLLVLIFRPGLTPSETTVDTGALLARTFQLEKELKQLDTLLQGTRLKLAENRGNNEKRRLDQQKLETQLKDGIDDSNRLGADIDTLKHQGDQLRSITVQRQDTKERDEEVGGIPVDSDYIVFVIDMSGSMRKVERQLLSVLESVLDTHPQVRGFQVLSDNGDYLFDNKRWLNDSKTMRRQALSRMRQWPGSSNSSPVEGVAEALRQYGNTQGKLALYVLGDDFTARGQTPDDALALINRLNSRRDGSKIARIHAIAFMAGNPGRFSTLMREVALHNDGTFIGL